MIIKYSKQAEKFLKKQDMPTRKRIIGGYLLEHFASNGWNSIKEEQPDEWDLKMLDDISKNPECHEFVSAKDLKKELGL